jgi:hypothetical protein
MIAPSLGAWPEVAGGFNIVSEGSVVGYVAGRYDGQPLIKEASIGVGLRFLLE